MPGRARKRGKFNTHLIAAFCDFVNEEGEDTEVKAQCFVDDEDLCATAILNYYHKEYDLFEQGHCDFVANIQLRKTAEFKALSNLDGQHLSQQQAAEFIEDYVSALTARDADSQDLRMSAVISTLRSLKIEGRKDSEHHAGDFKQSRSLMESMEAKGENLPNRLSFYCNPYHGLAGRNIDLRLSVITGDSPKFIFRIVQPEVMHEELAQEFKNKLEHEISKDVCEIHMGSFSR